jgi:hypothetical protein
VPFGVFAKLMDAVKQAGITNVSIVTQPLEVAKSIEPGSWDWVTFDEIDERRAEAGPSAPLKCASLR